MDKIFIKNLRLRGIIGIHPEERVKEQAIVINVVMFADIRPAAVSDDIADAVDYETIARQITRYVENSKNHLVEKLATNIARLVLTECEQVAKVRVRVEKSEALPAAQSVGVEIERTRIDFGV
ncbi:MAG TPA: dihydroneopterin aldolase [Anaerolineae bacterium]|nr:dihydroneopterin aldolase [Anaerolineae bacterium]HIP71354.1 dihydroneopterin aldolase [Anaerolineae bacterium]